MLRGASGGLKQLSRGFRSWSAGHLNGRWKAILGESLRLSYSARAEAFFFTWMVGCGD